MLAIIPARGGSKGVPGKNIKILNGKPLIAWTIEAAKQSKYINRIIVSTDDKNIADIAKKYDAEIPFLRPDELASDTSKAIDNYIYTIERLSETENIVYENFIVLQPTSPLRKADDIDRAIDLFNDRNADSVISFSEASHHPLWAKKINSGLKVEEYFNHDVTNKNRQEIPSAFMPNGAIFILKYDLLKEKYSYYSEKTYAYIMPQINSVDIDTSADFEFAEFLLRRNSEKYKKI